MFSGVRKRSRMAGQPPGTLIYTGNKKSVVPQVRVTMLAGDQFYDQSGPRLQDCLPAKMPEGAVTWIDVTGLNDINLMKEIAEHYHLHPLTVEDILNVEQRSKVEEFDDYLFLTLKVLRWKANKKTFSVEELSIVIGTNFVLSFQEEPSTLFDPIRERLSHGAQGLRKQSSDYLAYRLIDNVVDQYFLVLEGLGDQIEKVEDLIIASPTKNSARALYRIKRKMLILRKIIWPIREVINHLLKLDEKIISPFTQVYLRDVYDHTVQAIDTVETFRDMLSNMLDIYLSSLTNRLNEIMKVLTIITTTFIPVTFIASIYGMNFKYMPELSWKWSYPVVLCVMLCVIIIMAYYFHRKKWW